MKALLQVSWVLLFFGLSFADAVARPGDLPDAGIQSSFSREDVLTCGDTVILARTTCSSTSDGAPPRCTQRLVFRPESGAERSVGYVPGLTRHGGEPFLNQLSCNRVGESFYAIASIGNFSNCANCEWIDVFSRQGRLVGSTPSIARALKLPPRKLPRWLNVQLSHSQADQSIFIDRVPEK